MARTRFAWLALVFALVCPSLQVAAQDELEMWLFPRHGEFDQCSQGVREWINERVGRITVGCNRSDLFGGGISSSDTPLMRAGVGFHPYVAIAGSGRPHLRYAITLPWIEIQEVEALIFMADDAESTVAIEPGSRYLYVHPSPDTRFLSIDLHGDSLSKEFLRELTEAKVRMVRYGPDGKRKLKINKGDLRSIAEMTALFDALVEDAGGAD